MKNEKFIDLAGLVLSGMIGIVLLVSLHDRVNPFLNYREMQVGEAMLAYLMTLLGLFLLIVQAIGITFRFTQERQSFNSSGSVARLVIPIVIITTLLLTNQSSFPGTWASSQTRQQWAIEEFQNYDGVVKTIKHCKPIVDQVGQVQFVAPTRGANYVVSDPGSSGHSGEFTLEVVGDKATGVAYSTFHIETIIGYVEFTHQGRAETLKCF
ncbi:hypothetical protein LEP3755_11730 [Leptolyngbya sp. NIES-3755]|nr:hypothetical protein LEP3755_11730 [Leptolyngbya sp. NIES-3755]